MFRWSDKKTRSDLLELGVYRKDGDCSVRRKWDVKCFNWRSVNGWSNGAPWCMIHVSIGKLLAWNTCTSGSTLSVSWWETVVELHPVNSKINPEMRMKNLHCFTIWTSPISRVYVLNILHEWVRNYTVVALEISVVHVLHYIAKFASWRQFSRNLWKPFIGERASLNKSLKKLGEHLRPPCIITQKSSNAVTKHDG